MAMVHLLFLLRFMVHLVFFVRSCIWCGIVHIGMIGAKPDGGELCLLASSGFDRLLSELIIW